MPLDLDQLDQERTQWLPMQPPLDGVDLLIKYAAPGDAERFRQRMIRNGIMRNTATGMEINTGREKDFFREWAAHYVLDWRGDIKPEGTKYDAKQLGRLLEQFRPAFRQLSAAVLEDELFFGKNGTQLSET